MRRGFELLSGATGVLVIVCLVAHGGIAPPAFGQDADCGAPVAYCDCGELCGEEGEDCGGDTGSCDTYGCGPDVHCACAETLCVDHTASPCAGSENCTTPTAGCDGDDCGEGDCDDFCLRYPGDFDCGDGDAGNCACGTCSGLRWLCQGQKDCPQPKGQDEHPCTDIEECNLAQLCAWGPGPGPCVRGTSYCWSGCCTLNQCATHPCRAGAPCANPMCDCVGKYACTCNYQ